MVGVDPGVEVFLTVLIALFFLGAALLPPVFVFLALWLALSLPNRLYDRAVGRRGWEAAGPWLLRRWTGMDGRRRAAVWQGVRPTGVAMLVVAVEARTGRRGTWQRAAPDAPDWLAGRVETLAEVGVDGAVVEPDCVALELGPWASVRPRRGAIDRALQRAGHLAEQLEADAPAEPELASERGAALLAGQTQYGWLHRPFWWGGAAFVAIWELVLLASVLVLWLQR